jgi:hypothetical protein
MHYQKPDPGTTCLVCKIGKLQARTRSQSATNREVIGGPVFPTYQHLTELVCGVCGAKFEPSNVGQNISEALQDQLISFKNPEVKPEECSGCHLRHFGEGRVKTLLDTFPVGSTFAVRETKTNDETQQRYIYCRYCIKILWCIPLCEGPSLPADTIEKIQQELHTKPYGPRGPATPIPQARGPVRRTPDERPPKTKP